MKCMKMTVCLQVLWRKSSQRSRKTILFTAIFILVIYYVQKWTTKNESVSSLTSKDERLRKLVSTEKDGIPVILGKQMVRTYQSSLVNDKTINENRFNPIQGLGEHGMGVRMKNVQQIENSERLYGINNFNIVASDMISLNRSLPDVGDFAPKRCNVFEKDSKKNDLHSSGTRVSIIITYRNEGWSTLMRSIQTIFQRSDGRMLSELILVDDGSEREYLKPTLLRRSFTKHLREEDSTKIKMVGGSSGTHMGLMRARMMGVISTSNETEIVIFLDSHIEVFDGWLSPLVERVMENPTHVVSPAIDIIDEHTFGVSKSVDGQIGAFNWQMDFRWFRSNAFRGHLYYKSPVMAGGLFAINKSFFTAIGGYDEKMRIWGGENLELSFRIWMCGGKLEISRCSRVAHLFRSRHMHYGSKENDLTHIYENQARTVATWFKPDSITTQFINIVNPEIFKQMRHQNVDQRVRMIDTRCGVAARELFEDTFFKTVWGVTFFPTGGDKIMMIKQKDETNGENDMCITSGDVHAVKDNHQLLHLAPCNNTPQRAQLFVYKTSTNLIYSDEGMCIGMAFSQSFLKQKTLLDLIPCEFASDNHWWRWIIDIDVYVDSFIRHASGSKNNIEQNILCLSSDGNDNLVLERCQQTILGGVMMRYWQTMTSFLGKLVFGGDEKSYPNTNKQLWTIVHPLQTNLTI